MNYRQKIEDEVLTWPEISVQPHRFGGREFCFGNAEVGHVHIGGVVDIPFPRAIRDALLEEGLAEEHRWVPNSGWTTFRVRTAADLDRALWLMRLSYLRYAVKKAADPQTWLEEEGDKLHLSPRFKSLLKPFVPSNAEQSTLSALPCG